MSKQWYGSIQNRLSEKVFQPIPEIGMGATLVMWSDRHPYTVVGLSDKTVFYEANVRMEDGSSKRIGREYPKHIFVKEDGFKVIKGSMQDGSAKYEYFDKEDAYEEKFIFHKASGLYRRESRTWKEGEYVPTNRTNKEATAIILGRKEKYYDPSF